MSQRRILVTSALPYANGHIHLGHLVEYLQTDIWVRFQRLRGHRCIYLCADDTHGTAIMIRARQEGRTEEELIGEMSTAHQADFASFGIEFDNYGSTHSEENRQLCHRIWGSLREGNLVQQRDVVQLFDREAGTFLADRFVRGTCPSCGAENQPGDNCDGCGATYSPAELKNPKSALTGSTPELRSAPHLFVEMEALHPFLEEWTQTPGHLHPDIAAYLKGHFLGQPLRDWDVSRPAPYFGFEIPDAPGNYWYVWFDAPIGYIASTWAWCKRQGEQLETWWNSPETEIVHFIGKDITYFHTLFWPGMLKSAGFSLPSRVQIHGFLTVNGEKMSKSKGTFILASTYAKTGLDPRYLRYYYASKLGPKADDLDLNLEEFIQRVNADLVGKVVNLASRTARFVRETGLSAAYPEDGGLFTRGAAAGDEIAAAYEACDYRQAMRSIMALADRANEYLDRTQPWQLKKDPSKATELQDVCTVALNLYRQLVLYLKPVLPTLADTSAALLSAPFATWNEAATPLVGTPIGEFQHLMTRVDPKAVETLVEQSRMEAPQATTAAPASAFSDAPALDGKELAPTITIDDLVKVDLRVAEIIDAEELAEAKKLLKLTLGLGGNERRTVFAGIKSAFRPEQLRGRLVVMVANLAPRTMKFGVSEGMVMAVGPGGDELYLLSPDAGAKPGMRLS